MTFDFVFSVLQRLFDDDGVEFKSSPIDGEDRIGKVWLGKRLRSEHIAS